MRLSTGPLSSSVGEQPITSTTSAAVVSHPTTPSASSPSMPVIPSSPATATSPPLTADTQEEDVPSPQSPDHGNLGHNYSPPSTDPQGRRSISLSLKSERDQLLAERDQIDARLPVLEAKAAEAGELEARLQQSEQEMITLSQEASQLNREAASIERVNNLKAALNFKTAEAATTEEKRAQMEDRYKRIMEHNKVHITNICDLDLSLSATRSERNGLSTEVDRLKLELKRLADSLIIEKTYSMYSMRRKTLEEAKANVIDIDDEIAKAREVESTARRRLPVQPDATDSSRSGSEFPGTEEEIEKNNDNDQDLEPVADPPTSPGGADASLSPSSGGDIV
uniref:Dynactin subunit 1-like n=1 Tax=Nicotiana tabacum TaxID=4097 RepID=A0A1S3ZBN6_TOBAC|nr:PREDICTED: dynactin subunit 1-like [Nicotiana tabacum]